MHGQQMGEHLIPLIARWDITATHVERITTGLINQTYAVTATDEKFVLQSVNPIFSPRVNEDIDGITAHLASKGLKTPRLLRTTDGALWVEEDETVWRVMTWVDGETHDRARTPSDARHAGQMLAKFHHALSDLDWTFSARRLGVHDTARHLAGLQTALSEHEDHAQYDEISRLGWSILEAASALPSLPSVSERIVHGDPKISNILFDPSGSGAVAMVDLDTIAPMEIFLELGDAFRSWCNTSVSGENDPSPEFSLELFEAGVRGYGESASGFLTPEEQSAIVPATRTIIIELAARFCADALNDSYFGWNPDLYPSRSAHNLVRARGQFALARSLEKHGARADRIVERAFGG